MPDRLQDNLFADIPARAEAEQFRELLTAPALTIERIVSTGQATPPGEWLQQDRAEWVVLLRGAAALLFEGDDNPIAMAPGDYVAIAAQRRHRVEWTAAGEPTVWLAIHYAA